ncbi:MAG: hypothetical protein PT944_00085 [Actinomycetaceae bacterium]|nr:hypothetical protein [Actinomycetaceae bacterium]MDY5274162.1 hypothetical protein [Arcanobacterium sp.]
MAQFDSSSIAALDCSISAIELSHAITAVYMWKFQGFPTRDA